MLFSIPLSHTASQRSLFPEVVSQINSKRYIVNAMILVSLHFTVERYS